MSGPGPETVPTPVKRDPERLQKVVTVLVAVIAATGAVTGFLNADESGRASAETRAGLAAQSKASELHITIGRILDADFDYISEAEILAFSASEYDAAGLTEDADRARALARYLLIHTYEYGDYYMDADIDDAVDGYVTLGFDAIWAGYDDFRDDLTTEADAAQLTADGHLANASIAGRRAGGFILSITLMAVAVAIGAVALATKSTPWKLADMAVVAALYSLALANVAVTLAT